MSSLLKQRIASILGPDLVGLYLSGSLVTGDFDQHVSDIDLVAVTSTDLAPPDAQALEGMHREIAEHDPTWDNRVEVAYLSREALRTFRTRTSRIGIASPGEPFHLVDAGRDWLINWYVLRERGLALVGPPPRTLVAPISRAKLVAAARERARSYRTWDQPTPHRNSQVYTTLTMCRAPHTATTGEFASKPQAAHWTAAQLPEWSPFLEATLRAWREDWYDHSVDHAATLPDTRRFIRAILERLDRASFHFSE